MFGQQTGFHDADTALLAIMAKEKLTWFYWDQNRFGNLVPFATAWIRPIRLNLMAQLWLGSVAGFASIGFVMELAGIGARRVEAFAVTVIVLMTCMRPEFISGFFTGPVPYPVSCAMCYLALRVARAKRGTAMLALPAALFWLAFFVNAALAAFVLPVLALNCLRPGPRPRLTLAMALLGAAAAASMAMLSGPGTPSAITPGNDPMRAALTAMAGQFDATRLLAAVTVAAAAMAGRGGGAQFAVRSQTAAVVWAMLASACLYASLQWVQLNGNQARYYFAQVFTAATLVACWISQMLLTALPEMTRRGRAIFRHGLLAAALAYTVWVAGGVHAIRFVSAVQGRELAINADMKAIARQVPGDRPTVMVGDYWLAVPIVFALLDRAAAPRTFALTNQRILAPLCRKTGVLRAPRRRVKRKTTPCGWGTEPC